MYIFEHIPSSEFFCFCTSKNSVCVGYISSSEVLIFAQIKLHWCTALIHFKIKFKYPWFINLKCSIIDFLYFSGTCVNYSNKCIIEKIIKKPWPSYCVSTKIYNICSRSIKNRHNRSICCTSLIKIRFFEYIGSRWCWYPLICRAVISQNVRIVGGTRVYIK